MFSDLNVFKMAYAMATHAGKRQAVVSRNTANADTPGYRARDIEPFSETYANKRPGTGMLSTREKHFHGGTQADHVWPEFQIDSAIDPNKNSVSVEEEMLRAVDVKRQHDRALAIYRTSMNVLRTSLGRS